jgi:hypothetical protein
MVTTRTKKEISKSLPTKTFIPTTTEDPLINGADAVMEDIEQVNTCVPGYGLTQLSETKILPNDTIGTSSM